MADDRGLRCLDWTDTRSLVAPFLGMRLDPLAGQPLGLGDGVLVSPPTSYPHRIARAGQRANAYTLVRGAYRDLCEKHADYRAADKAAVEEQHRDAGERAVDTTRKG